MQNLTPAERAYIEVMRKHANTDERRLIAIIDRVMGVPSPANLTDEMTEEAARAFLKTNYPPSPRGYSVNRQENAEQGLCG